MPSSRRHKRAGRTGVRSISKRIAELVFPSYQDYLNSAHWIDVKRKFFASNSVKRDAKGKACCEACRKSGLRLSVHHRTYKRLGKERLMDLMAVCDECHKEIHHGPGYKENLWASSDLLVRQKRAEREGRSLFYATSRVVSGDPDDPVSPPWE